MKKILLYLVALLIFVGCEQPTDPEETDPWANHKQFMTADDYTLFIDSLESESFVDKAKIDECLETLNIRQNYTYSLYDSDYDSHSLTWSDWDRDTGSRIYLVIVSVWVTDANILDRDMSTYNRTE